MNSLAPMADIIHYTGVLHRFLLALRDYGTRQDPEGMLLCGHFAEALHNVPDLLVHYDQPNADRIRRETNNLHVELKPHVVAVCQRVFEPGDSHPSLKQPPLGGSPSR